MLLENRVALVTGGAKGMGRAIAHLFAKEGCDVAVAALHIEGAKKVAQEIEAMGRKSLAIGADISRSAEVKDMVDQTIKKFKKIDILVNNAGALRQRRRHRNRHRRRLGQDFKRQPQGAFLVTLAVVPYMKRKSTVKLSTFHRWAR